MTWQPDQAAARAELAIQRATAITVPCPYCPADVGQECYDPRTGVVLELQAAHYHRLQDAGVLF